MVIKPFPLFVSSFLNMQIFFMKAVGNDGALSGIMVISASPGGPASRAAISPGDLIMAIDNTSTETMDIYDAAERLE